MNASGSRTFPDGSSLVKARELAWTPWLGHGLRFKLLDVDRSFNKMSLLVEADAGATLAGYRHFGAGEYYVEAGQLDCDRGVLVTGDFLYEPGGASLRGLRFPVASQVYALIHGPLRLLSERPTSAELRDIDWHLQRAREHGNAGHIPDDFD
jgi:hypothetical protein